MVSKVLGKIVFVFCFVLFAVSAHAVPISDSYWGGAVSNGNANWGDIIGDVNQFGISGMDVTKVGDVFTVKVVGSYFSGAQLNSWGPGDLYINSHGYSATGSTADNYRTDTFTSAEGWNYVVTSTGIYALSFNDIKMTNAPSGYIYRNDQAWTGGAGTKVGEGWSVLDATGMTFTFNAANISLGDTIGLHWAMKCGNDTVEGSVPVPEPSTLILLGICLVGVAIGVKKFNLHA